MKLRHTPIYSNDTGRNAYVWSDNDGKTWCVTVGHLRGGSKHPTIVGLTKDLAIMCGELWVRGANLAQVRFGRAGV